MSHINDDFADDAILPAVYTEGADIFADAVDDGAAPAIETPAPEEGTEEAAPEEETPAIETQPAEELPTEKKVFKVKHNHEERDVTEDEAVPLIEKGLNYDKVSQRKAELETRQTQSDELASLLGYAGTDEMLEAARTNYIEQRVAALVDDGVHEAIARDLVQRDLDKKPVVQKVETESPDAERDKDLDAFVKLNPGVTKLPPEVVEAVKNGVTLTLAYERFKNKQTLEENRILKQNQAAAAKAPVATTTKQGGAMGTAKDPFLAGFDSD